jgi:hypothetical protein
VNARDVVARSTALTYLTDSGNVFNITELKTTTAFGWPSPAANRRSSPHSKVCRMPPLLTSETKTTFAALDSGKVVQLDEKANVTKLTSDISPLTSNPPKLSYTRDILPILTKAGCNLGSCHAKSSGQAGFRLSIFAFDTKTDFMEFVNDSRGRRVFPALPEDSLILQKATVRVQHEGGQRLSPTPSGRRPSQTGFAKACPTKRRTSRC